MRQKMSRKWLNTHLIQKISDNMGSFKEDKISYETPDFTNVTFEPKEDTSNHNPLEEEFKKTKEENIENEGS